MVLSSHKEIIIHITISCCAAMKWLSKVRKFISQWVVVEPMIFLYLLTNMNVVPIQNVYYDKYSAMYNGTVDREEKTEKSSNEFIRNITLTYAGISAVVMLIIGPLSDKYGRKFGILWTLGLSGKYFKLIFYHINSYQTSGLSNLSFGILYYLDTEDIVQININYYYIPAVICGLSGSAYNFFLTVFSYVGDMSNAQPSTRVKRYTNSEAMVGVSMIVGSYAGSLIVKSLMGDMYIFIICTVSCLLAFIDVALRLENIIPIGGEFKAAIKVQFDLSLNNCKYSVLMNMHVI